MTLDGQSPECAMGAYLKTTSNLVMDGADCLYFWNGEWLYGFDAKGTALFDKIPFPGLEASIRLMLGPDGTLWANNQQGRSLYIFEPQYKK